MPRDSRLSIATISANAKAGQIEEDIQGWRSELRLELDRQQAEEQDKPALAMRNCRLTHTEQDAFDHEKVSPRGRDQYVHWFSDLSCYGQYQTSLPAQADLWWQTCASD